MQRIGRLLQRRGGQKGRDVEDILEVIEVESNDEATAPVRPVDLSRSRSRSRASSSSRSSVVSNEDGDQTDILVRLKKPPLPVKTQPPKITITEENGNIQISGLEDVFTTALHPDIPPDWIKSPNFFTGLVQPYLTKQGKRKNQLPVLFRSFLLLEELWSRDVDSKEQVPPKEENKAAAAHGGGIGSKGEIGTTSPNSNQEKAQEERKSESGRNEEAEDVDEPEKTPNANTNTVTDGPQTTVIDSTTGEPRATSIFEKLSALENITRDYLLWELRTEMESILSEQKTDRQQLLRIRKLVKDCAQIWGTGDILLSAIDIGKLLGTALESSSPFLATGLLSEKFKERERKRLHVRRNRHLSPVSASSRTNSRRKSRWQSNKEARREIRKARQLRKLQLWPRLMAAVLGAIAFLVPMLVMAIHPSNMKSIIVSSAFIVGFSLLFAILAPTSPETVLVGTAAYAAVLVVFVGSNNT